MEFHAGLDAAEASGSLESLLHWAEHGIKNFRIKLHDDNYKKLLRAGDLLGGEDVLEFRRRIFLLTQANRDETVFPTEMTKLKGCRIFHNGKTPDKRGRGTEGMS